MAKLIIDGGNHISGTIKVSGSKNASLPIMTASLLTDDELLLNNVPNLSDVITMQELLFSLGTEIYFDKDLEVLNLRAKNSHNFTADYEIVRKMRASIIVLGPTLVKRRIAKVALPGGCSIGSRPIDLHLKGLEAMGANIYIDNGYVFAEAKNGLQGAAIKFPFVSVGATQNIILAATLASGRTTISNAACEPEIIDLCVCLRKMGAKIIGEGTKELSITGVSELSGATHTIMADRIELGTFMLAPAIAGGEIYLEGAGLGQEINYIKKLEEMGLNFYKKDGTIRVVRRDDKIKAVDVSTSPFPGFPTDLQPQIMSVMGLAEGTSTITENVFENRFMHAPELNRMGASISIEGRKAIISGVKQYRGVPVMASDLRAAASLVLAGLAAEGKTIIDGLHHLDRGYQNIESKLAKCGVNIYRAD